MIIESRFVKRMMALVLITSFVVLMVASGAFARDLTKGQTLYVPAYSYIYHGNKGAKINVTTTLSVRNTSREKEIRILRVDYHDTKGKLIRSYIEEPVVMAPLESLRYIVKLDDATGGSGANFIIEWEADSAVDKPIVETIMLGTGASFGFAFLTQAVEVE